MTRFLKNTAFQQDYAQQVRTALVEQCKRHDTKGAGYIAQDTFLKLIDKTDIQLSSPDVQLLMKEHSTADGSVRYESACKQFYYLKDTHEWIFSSLRNKLQPRWIKGSQG